MPSENGQLDTTSSPAPFDDLMDLLLSDPTSDLATDAPGREGSGNNDDGAIATLDDQGNGDGPVDLLSDEEIGKLDDAPRTLNPNGRRDPTPMRQSAPSKGQGKTFKVTVKGDDGADEIREVDEKERGAGYLRHSHFTKLTQELAVQRAQVMQTADVKIQAFHQQALDSVQRASAVLVRLAGFQTPAELAVLAKNDPAAYHAEQAREAALKAEIKALDDEAAAIIASRQQAEKEALDAAYVACWSELARMGLITLTASGRVSDDSEAKIKRVFEEVIKGFGIPAERFTKIHDPKLIAMMFAAVDMLDLKARQKAITTDLTKKATKPNLPRQRQHTPRQDQVNKQLDERFNSRRGARTEDLAAWIANNT